jgi:riboflavin synthase
MFTGIVRELGTVESLEEDGDGARLRVRAPEAAVRTELGDSVSVNGACSTSTSSRRRFAAARSGACGLARP